MTRLSTLGCIMVLLCRGESNCGTKTFQYYHNIDPFLDLSLVSKQTKTEMFVSLHICNPPTCFLEKRGKDAIQIQINSKKKKKTRGGFAIKHLRTVKSHPQAVQVYVLFIVCCWAFTFKKKKTCWTDLSVYMNVEKAGSGGGQNPQHCIWMAAESGSLASLQVLDVVRCSGETGCDLILSHLGPAVPAVGAKTLLMMLPSFSFPFPSCVRDSRESGVGDGHHKISKQPQTHSRVGLRADAETAMN